jgi:hypothetical protein
MESGVLCDLYAEKNDLYRGTDIESQDERNPGDGEEAPEWQAGPQKRAPAGWALMPVVPDVSGEDREKCDVCGGSGDCRDCKGTGNGGQCFNCAGTGNCPQCQGTGLRKKKAG